MVMCLFRTYGIRSKLRHISNVGPIVAMLIFFQDYKSSQIHIRDTEMHNEDHVVKMYNYRKF